MSDDHPPVPTSDGFVPYDGDDLFYLGRDATAAAVLQEVPNQVPRTLQGILDATGGGLLPCAFRELMGTPADEHLIARIADWWYLAMTPRVPEEKWDELLVDRPLSDDHPVVAVIRERRERWDALSEAERAASELEDLRERVENLRGMIADGEAFVGGLEALISRQRLYMEGLQGHIAEEEKEMARLAEVAAGAQSEPMGEEGTC